MEEPVSVQCPFCGEAFIVFVDPSVPDQTYIEDCQVCCRPIEFRAKVSSRTGQVSLRATRS